MAGSPYDGISRSSSSGSLRKRDYDYKFKLILIGDSGVGKSCLVSTFVNGRSYFSTTYVRTQVKDIASKVVEISGQRILLEIWDLSGADEERTITTSHYGNAHALVVVYSLTSEDSWCNVNNWIENFRMSIGENEFLNMPKVLVGAKKDSDYVTLDLTRGDQFSLKLKQASHITTSSKTGNNVELVFMTIANRLFERFVLPHLKQGDMAKSQSSSQDLLIPKGEKRKRIPCCTQC